MSEHEIMTVEEVAEYLRVSERTVYDWAQKGEIPCGKLGTTWRFKRSDVQRWVDQRLHSGSSGARAPATSVRDVLSEERVAILDESEKKAALLRMVEILAKAPQVRDRAELARATFEREELMSTGIGFGVGVPHVRLASVSSPVMAVGVSRQDIADYVSLDGKPVRIICMVAAGQNQHAEYLRTLAAVSGRLKDPLTRERILAAPTGARIFEILTS